MTLIGALVNREIQVPQAMILSLVKLLMASPNMRRHECFHLDQQNISKELSNLDDSSSGHT